MRVVTGRRSKIWVCTTIVCPKTVLHQPMGKYCPIASQKCRHSEKKWGFAYAFSNLGVTASPLTRFHMYKEQNYSSMWVLAESSSVDLVHMLEAALISEYHKHVGCKNAEGSGGDGALNRKPPAPPPYFMYIAGGRADQARWVVWKNPHYPAVGKKVWQRFCIVFFHRAVSKFSPHVK